ncbi:hypothetical protein ILUMI_11282 [Ignelater luminosus]|uniref:RNase H type-1 domain-containing protein n=1 Tax=Ignelater luminosus TaxID=2038154 RepID=A0A8K0D2E3_IGNLU|nr:hypothetical protein ILUMI_11282 [Ignelater luminosus]
MRANQLRMYISAFGYSNLYVLFVADAPTPPETCALTALCKTILQQTMYKSPDRVVDLTEEKQSDVLLDLACIRNGLSLFRGGRSSSFLSSSVREIGHPADIGKLIFKIMDDEREELKDAIQIYTILENNKSGKAYEIYSDDREIESRKSRLGAWSLIFQCQLLAIGETLKFIRDNEFVFEEFTLNSDSRSVYKEVEAKVKIKVKWVKAHVGIEKNKRVDELAKEVALEEGVEIDVRHYLPNSSQEATQGLDDTVMRR